ALAGTFDRVDIEWCTTAAKQLYDLDTHVGDSDEVYYNRLSKFRVLLMEEEERLASKARKERLEAEAEAEERQHRQSVRQAELAAITSRVSLGDPQASSTLNRTMNSTFSSSPRPRPKES